MATEMSFAKRRETVLETVACFLFKKKKSTCKLCTSEGINNRIKLFKFKRL